MSDPALDKSSNQDSKLRYSFLDFMEGGLLFILVSFGVRKKNVCSLLRIFFSSS